MDVLRYDVVFAGMNMDTGESYLILFAKLVNKTNRFQAVEEGRLGDGRIG